MNYAFWDEIFDNLNEKLINETAEELIKHQADEISFTEIMVQKPAPKKFNIGALIGIAAAVAFLIGAVFVAGIIKNSDVQIVEKPPYSNTTEYEKIRVYNGRTRYTEIDLSIADDYSRYAVKLIETLEEIKLIPTEYSLLNFNQSDLYTILLYKENGEKEEIKFAEAYIEGRTFLGILEKSKESYEISEGDYSALKELSHKLTDSAVYDVIDGTYYPISDSEYTEKNVYITVDNGKIWLRGSDAYDFVFDSLKRANPDKSDKEIKELADFDYNEVLGIEEYVVSYDDTMWMSGAYTCYLVTNYEGEKINGNRYGRGMYLIIGNSSLSLYGTEFKLGGTDSIHYEASFSRGKISFTEIDTVGIESTNEVCAKFDSETDARDYAVGLTISENPEGMSGIYRLGETTLKTYELDLSRSYYKHGQPVATLYFEKTEGTYFKINIADRLNETNEGMPLPNGMSIWLKESEIFDYSPTYSEFKLEDDTILKLAIGGVYYANIPYYQAEWTDPGSGLSICVGGRNMTVDDFINVVITLVYDINKIDEISAENYNLPTDFDSYEMDFGVFYNYFRGEWTADDGELVDIGWSDNIFTYTESCVGFYTGSMGACMLQADSSDEKAYTLWYVPNYNKNMLVKHSRVYNGEERSWMSYDKLYTKTSSGDFNGSEGLYGNLGLQELCIYEGIDYYNLYNLEIMDKSGNRWIRTSDTSIDWGVTGVSERSYGNVVLHLKMLNPETNEMKYFSFTYISDDSGNKVLSDEHYDYDISILDYENYPSEIVDGIKESISVKEYEDRLSVETEFYPMADGSYYAVRQLGTIQAQWLGDIEVYYNDGNGYKLVSDEYTPIMGMIYSQCDDERFYILWCELGEFYYSDNTFHIDCIENGEIISSIELTELTIPNGFHLVDKFSLNENTINLTTMKGYDDEKCVITVDYSNPHNPVITDTKRVVEGEAIPQQPIDGYSHISELGEMFNYSGYTSDTSDGEAFICCVNGVYAVESDLAEKLYYDNGECFVLAGENGKGFFAAEGELVQINVEATCVPDYSSFDGELVDIGYLYGEEVHDIYSDKISYDGREILFTAPKTGYYKFYFINACAGLQNYERVTVTSMSREEIENYEEQLDKIISQAQQNSTRCLLDIQ